MPLKDELFRCSVDFRAYTPKQNGKNELGRDLKAPSTLRRSIADALDRGHNYLEHRLLAIFRGTPLTRADIEGRRDALADFVRDSISPLITYLVRYFRTADEIWLFLYAGEMLRLVEDLQRPPAERAKEIEDVVQRERRLFTRFLQRRVQQEGLTYYQRVHDAIQSLMQREAGKDLRVLLVGDCLFTEVVNFLRPKCADDGVSLVPVRITSKNPIETRQLLIEYSQQKFDAVFWSPFTYENLREYGYLLSWKARNLKGDALTELVNETIRQTWDTADIFAKYYDCAVFVHNCGGFQRWEGNPFAATVKRFGTARVRRTARDAINRWLQLHIEEKNAATFDHLFLLDEEALVKTFGEPAVGKFISRNGDLHAAVFGKILADFYRDIVFVLAHLKSKKLIICDLDNTLWRGTIGEAAVSPFRDRQTLLQRLKSNGVLLAVCSKNNPQDVSWQGNMLGESDFVASRINWEPKPHNVRSIESELKLKRKDFVFVDDSPLERDVLATELPEVSVLDPDAERTWRLLKLWAQLLGKGSSEDRTSYYLNEKDRSKALEETHGGAGDLVEALAKLRIKVSVREAERSDLQRAVELINRTNQFNLCGTRTTFREMQAWLNSDDRKIIVGQAEDKFGSMGIVCIAVTQSNGDAVHIPAFVLSCRVIGYGIESAVLNYICTSAQVAGAKAVIGHMKPTAHNEPCRQMYPNAGFTQQNEGRWHSNGSPIPPSAWLEVDSDMEATASAG